MFKLCLRLLNKNNDWKVLSKNRIFAEYTLKRMYFKIINICDEAVPIKLG